MTALYIILGYLALFVIALAIAVKWAPLGYEDDIKGFCKGKPSDPCPLDQAPQHGGAVTNAPLNLTEER